MKKTSRGSEYMPINDRFKSKDDVVKVESAEIKLKERDCGNYGPLLIDIEGCNMLRAFIYTEVLGKPRCKRRGRWR